VYGHAGKKGKGKERAFLRLFGNRSTKRLQEGYTGKERRKIEKVKGLDSRKEEESVDFR